MARVNVVKYQEVDLLFDFDADSTFEGLCSINGDKAVAISTTYTETTIPDCDNPDLPDVPDYTGEMSKVTFSGSGKLDAANIETLTAAAYNGTKVAAKAVVGKAGNGTTIAGEVVIEEFSVNATRKQYADVTISGMFAGAVTFTAIPAA